MDGLTIALSALLSLLSPAGLLLEGLSETALRDRLDAVEDLRVRVDNVPTHQIFQGRVDRVRIAGRGLTFKQIPLKIALLEVETDPIDFDLQNLENGLPQALQQPLKAGIRLILTEEGLNQALQPSGGNRSGIAPTEHAEVEDLPQSDRADSSHPGWAIGNYTLFHPQIDFLEDSRWRIQVEIQEGDQPQRATIVIESGLEVRKGHQLVFVAPLVLANGEVVPPQLLDALFGGQERVLDLDRLTPPNLTIRLLEWHLTPDRIELAAFVRLERKNPERESSG